MWVILLEAAAALGLLVFIVWWTMFSGRPRGERPAEPDRASTEAADVARKSTPGHAPKPPGHLPE